jgi:hypothetical protein
MLRNAGGGAGGGGGMPDLASLMNNPMMMQMAQQMMASGGMDSLMSNPAVANMVRFTLPPGGILPTLLCKGQSCSIWRWNAVHGGNNVRPDVEKFVRYVYGFLLQELINLPE